MKSMTGLTGHFTKRPGYTLQSVSLYILTIFAGFLLEIYLLVMPWKFITRVWHDGEVIFKLPEMINLSGTRTQ